MPSIVIAGGGFAGLAASLFLARRGHAVTLIERDGPPSSSGSADDDAERWQRPGAPQSRQSHLLLGRVPVVTSVRTRRGEVLSADLFVDAGGHRSALPAWLAALGTRPPVDEVRQPREARLT